MFNSLHKSSKNAFYILSLIITINLFHINSFALINPVKNSLGRLQFNQKAVIKPNISKFNKQIIFDAKQKSCDIYNTEKVQFQFDTPSNLIHHLIISKKNPLYGFSVTLPLNANLSIVKLEIFQDKGLRNKFYENKGDESLSFFRDRWLISVLLDKKVNLATILYSYYTQGSLSIDENHQKDLIKLYMVNPYPYDIKNFKIDLTLLNFRKLSANDLIVPEFSVLTKVNLNNQITQGKGFNISIKKNLPVHSEFFMQLALPMDIKTCDSGLANIVYYSLIGMTIGFVLISFSAVYFLYKE